MKRAIQLSLACSVVAFTVMVVAEEPKQSATPVTPGAMAPDGQQWLGKYKWPYGKVISGTRAAILGAGVPLIALQITPPSQTCYFIRSIRPVPADDNAKRSGLIPLQSRVAGTVEGPVCTSPGMFQRLVPVHLKIESAKFDKESAR